MRKLFFLAVMLLNACASAWDDDEARCREIEDDAVRRACLEHLLADERERGDNNGIGPPSCHPASTRPDPDRDPC